MVIHIGRIILIYSFSKLFKTFLKELINTAKPLKEENATLNLKDNVQSLKGSNKALLVQEAAYELI